MKKHIIIAIFFFVLLFQCTIVNKFTIVRVTPDLIFCFSIAFVFLFEEKFYSVVSIITSILYDILMSKYVGISALSLVIVFAFIIVMKKNIDKEYKITIIMTSIASNIIYSTMHLVINFVLENKYDFLFWSKYHTILTIYNMCIIFIIYLIFIKRVIKHRGDRYLIWKKY